MKRQRVWRVVDANANRAHEGLRVCEDLVRFCLGSAEPFRALRALRHALAAQLRKLPVRPLDLAQARDSRRDPGREASGAAVKSVEHLLLINLQRTKEALRVLEESCRLLAPAQAPGFQRLRFRTYDVERTLLIGLAALRDRRSRRRARA